MRGGEEVRKRSDEPNQPPPTMINGGVGQGVWNICTSADHPSVLARTSVRKII
jgi:hypothetical protein